MKLVSILLPCYNAENYISEALESLINQTYKHLEIILINDGSTDNTMSICEEYAKKDERISIFVNDQNMGLIYTLNKAVTLAKGEFIARMDADDISHPNRIERQVQYLEQHDSISILGTRASASWKELATAPFFYLQPETIALTAYLKQPFFHGSVMARAPVFKENQYSMEYPHSEDFELWLRLIDQGHQVANLNEVLYIYRKNESGVSQSNEIAQMQSHAKASKKYLEKLLHEKLDSHLIDIINSRPMSKITLDQYKESLALWKKILGAIQPNNTDEINRFKRDQLLNIQLQSIKMSSSLALSLQLIFSILLNRSFYGIALRKLV